MIKLFLYDQENDRVVLNEPDILLIKEFSDLWSNDRNKNDLAYRELKYIYLAIDWRSPYNQYSEEEKVEQSKIDAELTDAEFNDPVFRAACRKYVALQNESKVGRLLRAQYGLIDRMTTHYETLDVSERDMQGKPVFKPNDLLKEMTTMSSALEGLKQLEEMWKKEQREESAIRGGMEKGFLD